MPLSCAYGALPNSTTSSLKTSVLKPWEHLRVQRKGPNESGANSLFSNILAVTLLDGIFYEEIVAEILKTKNRIPGGSYNFVTPRIEASITSIKCSARIG
jgi:hypothetical protein